MQRIEVLQRLIDHFGYQRYLEIGVYKGKTFLPLRCRYKIAVDPALRLSPISLLKWTIRYPTNLRNHYFWMSSDLFFSKKEDYLKRIQKLDVVLVDGLHTFEASLKDVLHSLRYIDGAGTVVLHDCFPPHEAAATPADSLKAAELKDIPGWTGTWCGDVWKSIVYLKEMYADELEVSVLNTDLGLGIIRLKGDDFPHRGLVSRKFKEINALNFQDLKKDPEELINLRDPVHFENLLGPSESQSHKSQS